MESGKYANYHLWANQPGQTELVCLYCWTRWGATPPMDMQVLVRIMDAHNSLCVDRLPAPPAGRPMYPLTRENAQNPGYGSW